MGDKRTFNPGRRRIIAAAGGVAAAMGSGAAFAGSADSLDLTFPGQKAKHHIVYQLNQADHGYQQHILSSVQAMLRYYGSSIHIVVTCFAEGISVVLKKPVRPVAKSIRVGVASLHDYGVEFHGCGNTLRTLKLTKSALLPLATYVPMGAADLMELQHKGYAYIAW
ncbi:DsrE family protein [Acidiferrobacter sp.]|jgi:intracellular sulfur oxidation DsrE/DsrF family protein|uniref:DsrE family protein n=1 Tax=Acidiferrobacter sp. TaxID=1872107 RepID=UPI00261C1519|nr:DsrE family protein [Acidiferrobacter sp.]